MQGATVTLQNTNTGTSADAEGNYSLTIPQAGILTVSFVGYDSKSIRVNASGVYDVGLDATTQTLQDVVVIGYGTQRITKTSGAISTVKSEDIKKLVPLRAEDALQGRAAGVNVIQAGAPGSRPTVLIRGIPSFSGTDPVVIIDLSVIHI